MSPGIKWKGANVDDVGSSMMMELKIGATWIYHGICRSLIGKVEGKDGEIAGLEWTM